MHLGNVFAALIAWLSVRSKDGEMVLRMEDLDTQRTSDEFAEALRQDLSWLGLSWDVETPPQSKRGQVYDRYFEMLTHFYRCVRGETENEFTPDYELALYKLLLRCCGA